MSLPILRLRLAGRCGSLAEGLSCGTACLSGTEEERANQHAACTLQSVPIIWHRKVKVKVQQKQEQNTDQMKASSSQCELKKEAENENPKSPQSVIPTSEKEEDTSTHFYTSIDAVMSVCDSESGPALEIKANENQMYLHNFMQKYDIVDENADFDVISSFNNQYFFERIIPLSMIDHAAPGKYYDFENILHTSRGICDCAVKVYGRKFPQIILPCGRHFNSF